MSRKEDIHSSVPATDGLSPILTHFRQARCEHDHLVDLAHALHESIHPRSFDDKDVVHLVFDFDWDDKVRRVYELWAKEGHQ